VIDITTGFYEDLKLPPEISNLITEGLFSVLIAESYQKFGLLHSDQPQAGRFFGVYSKLYYDQQTINNFNMFGNAIFASNNIDVTIATYIRLCCTEFLEPIKKRHFNNGYFFSEILRCNKVAPPYPR
jgi:hypothetical protein